MSVGLRKERALEVSGAHSKQMFKAGKSLKQQQF